MFKFEVHYSDQFTQSILHNPMRFLKPSLLYIHELLAFSVLISLIFALNKLRNFDWLKGQCLNKRIFATCIVSNRTYAMSLPPFPPSSSSQCLPRSRKILAMLPVNWYLVWGTVFWNIGKIWYRYGWCMIEIVSED